MSWRDARIAVGLFACGLVGLAPSAAPAASASTQAKSQVSEEANAALTQMGQTLLAKELTFQARTLRVYADEKGRFLHIGHTLKVSVRRPDRMRVDVDGDDGASQMLYDGKSVVLYSPTKKEYVKFPAPPTIPAMLDQVVDRMGVDFPLADFLTDAPNKSVLSHVTEGRVVNTVTINGAPSLHLALAQPGLELELWLTKNQQSLPERVFITYRSVPGQPSFVAQFSDWNLSPTLSDATFEFKPPEGAKEVQPVPPPASAAKAKGARR